MFPFLRYEREEAFIALNLTVKNATLQDSLDQFVKGELLDGDNAYFCEKCGEKVRLYEKCGEKVRLYEKWGEKIRFCERCGEKVRFCEKWGEKVCSMKGVMKR